jgi:hypothetical protein
MSDNALSRLREKVDQIVKLEKDVAWLGLRGEPAVEDFIVRLRASVWVDAVTAAYSVTEVLPGAQKTLINQLVSVLQTEMDDLRRTT